jgi:hypothetical protein
MVSLDGASRIAKGDEVEIYVGACKVHLFDPMTGEYLWSICPTPTPTPTPAASAVARPRRGQGQPDRRRRQTDPREKFRAGQPVCLDERHD